MGSTLNLVAEPSSVFVDDYGIGIGLGTSVYTSNWVLADTGLGSLYDDYPVATFSSNIGIGVALSSMLSTSCSMKYGEAVSFIKSSTLASLE